MDFIAGNLLIPIEAQNAKYLRFADCVFQKKDNDTYAILKDRVNIDRNNCDYAYIQSLLDSGKKVSIVSYTNRFHIESSNMIMLE